MINSTCVKLTTYLTGGYGHSIITPRGATGAGARDIEANGKIPNTEKMLVGFFMQPF